jgi:hypothetical protein
VSGLLEQKGRRERRGQEEGGGGKHPTNTLPLLGINCTLGVIFLEENKTS